MPSLLLPRFVLQDMSDKKSPPRKEKPFIVRTHQQPDDKGMKRKLLSPGSPTHDDDDKKTPNKRKRGSLSLEASPMTNAKTPGGGSRSVPLSERQQLAMIMRMADESTQENSVKPPSPTPLQPVKKTQVDKKVFKRNERGEMPIHIAAIKGDIKVLKKLIKAGADVNVADFAGWTPLHEASNRGWFSIAKQLLKAGANVNVQGLENDTPLHDASINGHRKLVQLLLKHGANPLQPNAKGKTPLDVASSPDLLKILKKETICSGSDSSSIDDVRSPTSPDSVISMKDDEKSMDSEDLGPQHRSESSANRRLSVPKSPDNKLSSPRLCLKFHRDHFGQNSQKSRDPNEPLYKSYSVTNLSDNVDTPMFSPIDSPASSVDSDAGSMGLDNFSSFSGSRLKISLPDDENSQDYKSNISVPSLRVSGSPLTGVREVCPDQGNNFSEQNSDMIGRNCVSEETTDADDDKLKLKPMETLPFQANFHWSDSINEDSLPDLEIDTSDSVQTDTGQINSVEVCNTVTSSSVDPKFQGQVNHSSVTSTTENVKSQTSCNQEVDHEPISPVTRKGPDKIQSDCVNSNSESVESVTNQPVELTSPSVTSAAPAGVTSTISSSTGSAATEESASLGNEVGDSKSEKSCSPNSSRDSKDSCPSSRPNSPKVPPLKIIIPPKSQPSSTPSDTNDRLRMVTKSALPYVINPFQGPGSDSEAQALGTVTAGTSLSSDLESRTVNNVSHSQNSLDIPADLDYPLDTVTKDKSDQNSDENVDMDVDSNGIKPQDEVLSEKVGSEACDIDKKDDVKKEEPTQRVLRSAVRSQQQMSTESKTPKSVKPSDRVDRNSNAGSPVLRDDQSVTSSKPGKDEEDISIHPRKRKLRPKPDSMDSTTPVDVESPEPAETGGVEKVPNPYEIYLALRKQIASRRRNYVGMWSICPKTPQGFKEYLLKTCNYVLQGNSTSTLSIPTLSPPNSVKDKMRDQFVIQEEGRYKLRLQHLIEREKLILAIEQEILREHGRAARAIANQGTPLSMCTILRDQEIYNFTEDQVRLEEKDKKNRTRYNGRQFLSWIQDVDDKFEKIKELLILRQKQEADSLYAYQRLEWEWRLKELNLCDRNVTPEIDELHVPLVHVQDNFDLLPT